ncbi:MAG: tetratricopeptide repeat protein [Gammaproteobacteria bacterium]
MVSDKNRQPNPPRQRRFRPDQGGGVTIPIGRQLLSSLKEIKPRVSSDPRIDEAKAFLEAGKKGEAAARYRAVLRDDPNQPEALDGLSDLLMTLGFPAQALPLLERLGKRRLDSASVRIRKAQALSQMDRLDEALIASVKAVELRPGDPRTHINLGTTLSRMGQPAAAAEAFERAIELDPQDLLAHFKLGECQLELAQAEQAVQSFRTAVNGDPSYAEAWCGLGQALLQTGQSSQAQQALKRARSQRPRDGLIALFIGEAYADAGESRLAIPELQRAVELLASEPDAVNNPLRPVGGMDDPLARAHYLLATALLGNGQLGPGWTEFSWRYRYIRGLGKRIPNPPWNGERLNGKVLRVNWEQSMSDTIQFLRFLRFVKYRGAKVLFECQQPLKGLLQGVAGIDWLMGSEDKAAPVIHDVGTTLLELPRLLDVDLETIPAAVPYLYAPSAASNRIKPRIRGKGIRVGLVWSGYERHAGHPDRTLPMQALAGLMDVPGVSFFSLQGGVQAEAIRHLPDGKKPRRLDLHIHGLEDLAAALGQMDLLIGVESLPIHLAGAMGRSAWVLLPREPDWRWQLEMKQSIWYPTLRLFPQQGSDGWEGVIHSVKTELQQFVRANQSKQRR